MLTVAALYHFAKIPDPTALRAPLLAACQSAGVNGSLLLASEGINGTIAGPDAAVERALAGIRALPGFAGLDVKFARAATAL